jgi:virulence-associated protein VapD
LLQWKGDKDVLWVNINTIIERIPMIEDEKRYQKRYIKKALKMLNDKNVINIIFDNKNKDLVCCDFTGGKFNEELKNKFKQFSEIKEFLYSVGFNFVEIDKYLSDDNIQNIRQIQALLRYIIDRNKQKTDKNIKNYIIKALENPRQLDSKYYVYEE